MSKIEKLIEAKDRKLERKQFVVAEIKAVDEPQGIIEAIVSVFGNEDDGGDTVQMGAFAASLVRKFPKGVWMHDWTQPVAKTLAAEELAPGDYRLPERLKLLGGLWIRAQFNLATQRGREAFSDIAFGIVDEFSIGYFAIKVLWDETNYTRVLIECELVEWSPVLMGMNRETALISAKSGAGDASPLSADLEALVDGAKRLDKESERVLARVEARKELRSKAGRELSSANETMLDECATAMEGHAANIRGLLSRVQGEASRDMSSVKAARALLAKQLELTPQLEAIIQAIDDLVDMLLGEPEDAEPADEGKAIMVALEAKRRKAHEGMAAALLGAVAA